MRQALVSCGKLYNHLLIRKNLHQLGTARNRWGRLVLFLCDLALRGFSFFWKLVVEARNSLAGGAPRWGIWPPIKQPGDARWNLRRLNVSVYASQALSELLA